MLAAGTRYPWTLGESLLFIREEAGARKACALGFACYDLHSLKATSSNVRLGPKCKSDRGMLLLLAYLARFVRTDSGN